jgi:nitroreductase
MINSLDPDTVEAALELAVRAPSIHNSQPWRFRVGPDTIALHADPARQLDATDPDGRDRLISCGAALHHLRVALAGLGWLAVTDRLPDPDQPEHLATIEARPRVSTHADLAMAVSIPRRRSDRRGYRPGRYPRTASRS